MILVYRRIVVEKTAELRAVVWPIKVDKVPKITVSSSLPSSGIKNLRLEISDPAPFLGLYLLNYWFEGMGMALAEQQEGQTNTIVKKNSEKNEPSDPKRG